MAEQSSLQQYRRRGVVSPAGHDAPPVAFFWVDFFEFLFLLKNLGVVEERESRASALSLSLLHDDTAIRCEEQLIKH